MAAAEILRSRIVSMPTAPEKGSPAWDAQTFSAMLAASAGFKRLDSDVRDTVLPHYTEQDLEGLVDRLESAIGEKDYSRVVDGLIDGSVHYSHSGYLNQQLNFPVASSSIGAFWGSILNQGHAVFSMSPMTSVIEKRMLDWAKAKLCLAPQAFGLSTGGGSLATLTALLAARNRLDRWRAWDEGQGTGVRIVVSEHTHYSAARAASILGIGQQQVVAVEVDARGSIRLDRLGEILAGEGPHVVCLTLGTTASGALDDVRGFFEAFGERDPERLWVHVDAAHGGSFHVCEEHRAQFQALRHADSVCWDLHKVYFQSVPLSFLFFRDRSTAGFVSRHRTPYLTQERDGPYPDMHNWTLECSRSGNALKLWMSLHTLGEAYFATAIRHLATLTKALYRHLLAEPRIELYAPPATNILCFRVRSDTPENQATARLLNRLHARGDWSVGHVDIGGVLYIKVCFMNPRMTLEQVRLFSSHVATLLEGGGSETSPLSGGFLDSDWQSEEKW